ncbi:helix-turn-helix domain-containing protein [Pararhizobium sp. PWRC1-1]|uniref:helix-turn-helix domain-containing protein n=1 Tax=Pararhizobium sp. PWRC1-1 TaxID=2804566 RepID=UPI003CF8B2A6
MPGDLFCRISEDKLRDAQKKGQQRPDRVPIAGQDAVRDKPGLPPLSERRRWPRQPSPAKEGSLPCPPALEPLHFSTRDLVPADQFAAWQAYLAPLIDIELPDGVSPEAGFPADHTAWNLGSMLIVQQRAPPHSYIRSAAKLRSNSIDHWHIVLLRTGRTWTEVDRHVSEGAPGKVELRSLGRPFRGRSTDSQSLTFYLPRELFSDATPSADVNNNTALTGTYTDLLIEYMKNIEARLSSLAAADLPQVVRTTRDMILTCLSASAEHSGPAETQGNLDLIGRVRRFVQSNLNSPDLTSDILCRELGVSRTRLYQLFEQSGGVHHYIQKRRLLSAHAALSNSANRQQIVEIASAVGFTSAAHFSRAFSKEFGYSPRQARNVAIPPYFAHAVGPVEVVDSAHCFDAWLKSLGH